MQRVDAVLVVSLAAAAGPFVVVAPASACAALAVLAFWLARARAVFVLATCLVAFGATALRASSVVEGHERAREAARRGPSRIVVEGTVARSPVMSGDRMRVEIEAAEGRISLHAPREVAKNLVRGDRIEAVAQVASPYRFANEVRDPRPREARRKVVLSGGAEDVVVLRRGTGVRARIDAARNHVRDRILATFPGTSAAMARALVLGEDDLLDADRNAFRSSGLAHLLAVSGMHLVLVVAGAVAALRAVLVRVPPVPASIDAGRVAAAAGIPLAWAYAELAGASGSAIRAAWMSTVALAARVLARRPDAARSLALSIAAMIATDPLTSFDESFLLSVLATAGLVFGARAIAARLRFLPDVVAHPLATTAAATIACAPVLATMGPELSISGLVANVVAVPIGEAAALPLCLLHAVLSSVPAAERGCALAASGALVLVRGIAHAFAVGGLPVPWPTSGQLAAIAAGAATWTVGRRPRLAVASAAVAVLVLEAAARVAPSGKLRATFLDVGQGDAALVDLPDGSLMLVDGGGLVGSPVDVGERVIAPVLRARRRDAIDVVVLTHPHPDHFLGLRAALERVTVRAFWDTGQGETEGVGGAYAELLSSLRRRGTTIVRPPELCGRRSLGGATVDVLAPCPAPTSDRGPNDNSFVFAIRHGRRTFLFVGDAERELEGELVVAHGGVLRADVLKVGHHGSRTSSTPGFLTAVKPEIAVVSCGVRNRFGHPHPQALSNIDAAGARLLRTDRDGAIAIETDGASLDVQLLSTTPMYGRFL